MEASKFSTVLEWYNEQFGSKSVLSYIYGNSEEKCIRIVVACDDFDYYTKIIKACPYKFDEYSYSVCTHRNEEIGCSRSVALLKNRIVELKESIRAGSGCNEEISEEIRHCEDEIDYYLNLRKSLSSLTVCEGEVQ